MRVVKIGAIIALTASLCACDQTDRYEKGYEEGYAEAQAEGQVRITELEQIIEDAQVGLSNASSAVDRAQSLAADASSEAGRFGYDDWEYVVGPVQSAADDTESAIQEASGYLGEVESTLSGY